MLALEGVRKAFNGLQVLDGITFSAPDGAVTGLIGPNGAGKTTTLRVLYTLYRPDAGSARIDGFDSVSERRQAQRRIGVLPDQRGLYPRLTAREHVRYFARLHGLDGAGLEHRIDALMERLEMRPLADRRTAGFSKGESMKLALARALVHEPQNLLLDEPTSGLDIASARAVRGLVRELAEAGRCILFSSHIMQEVAAICDHLVVIAAGRVVAQGPPEALRQRTGQHDLEEAFLHAVAAPAAAAGED